MNANEQSSSVNKTILIIIFLIAVFTRTYNLWISPPGFNADEAALGYNAYSILQTGKDEWGETLPLVLKSFSDYKPGIYLYLAMPFVYFFDLSELSVRAPSILLGILSVLLIYYLSKEIFKNQVIALSTAFLLAFSPWHIHYSRGAWETNIATFFILLGVLAFVKGLNNHKYFYLSTISFILSMYSYQSTRVVVPALLILFGLTYFKFLFGRRKAFFKKELVISILLGGALLLPLFFLVFSDKGLARFQGISIFTDTGPVARIIQERGEHEGNYSFVARVYHNKLAAYGLTFFQNYFSHFSPSFLFVNGDPLGRNKVPEMGELYFFETLTLILGLYLLFTRRFNNARVVFIWLLVAPIAASLTYQTPHALRAHNMVIPLTLISGAGLGMFINFLWRKNILIRYSNYFVIFIVMVFFITKFFHQYFVHLPKAYALEWEYGFSELVPYVMNKRDDFDKVVITTRYDQPYILFLFYSKYDPSLYQKNFKPTAIDKFGFSTVSSFDNLEFREIKKDEDFQKNYMYVGTDEQIPKDKVASKIITFPNGEPAFKIIEVR